MVVYLPLCNVPWCTTFDNFQSRSVCAQKHTQNGSPLPLFACALSRRRKRDSNRAGGHKIYRCVLHFDKRHAVVAVWRSLVFLRWHLARRPTSKQRKKSSNLATRIRACTFVVQQCKRQGRARHLSSNTATLEGHKYSNDNRVSHLQWPGICQACCQFP